MINGKTKSGFEFQIEDSRLDNMELVDALVEVEDGNTLSISKCVNLLLGPKLKKELYDHLRTQEGNVPCTAVTKELIEILESSNKSKNLSS